MSAGVPTLGVPIKHYRVKCNAASSLPFQYSTGRFATPHPLLFRQSGASLLGDANEEPSVPLRSCSSEMSRGKHQNSDVLVVILALDLENLDREDVRLHVLHAVCLDQKIPVVHGTARSGTSRKASKNQKESLKCLSSRNNFST